MATATATAIMTSTDEQIQRDVLAELKWDARVQPNEIGVAVKDGVVTLTGWVDSYTKRWAAEEAAHRVRGVKAVANDIEVRLPISAERTDADIAAAAVRALAAAKGLALPKASGSSSNHDRLILGAAVAAFLVVLAFPASVLRRRARGGGR